MIDGMQYIRSYLDHHAHQALLAAVDRHPWLDAVDHFVQIYGYRYDKRTESVLKVGDLPDWVGPLSRRLHANRFIPSLPNQLVVNAYPPGTGIFDHLDQSAFGETVVSVSLGSTCVMRFTRDDTPDAHELLLEPRSVIVLSGEARSAWKHGIPARLSDTWNGREYVRKRRVSLTFRAVPD